MTATNIPGPVFSEMTAEVADRLARVLAAAPDTEVKPWTGAPGETGVAVTSATTGTALFRRVTSGEEEVVGWGSDPMVYRFPGPGLSGAGQPVTQGVANLWAWVTAVLPAATQ